MTSILRIREWRETILLKRSKSRKNRLGKKKNLLIRLYRKLVC